MADDNPQGANWRPHCTQGGKRGLEAVEIEKHNAIVETLGRDKYRRGADRETRLSAHCSAVAVAVAAVAQCLGRGWNLGHGHPNLPLTHVGSQQKNVKQTVAIFDAKQSNLRLNVLKYSLLSIFVL